MRWEDDDATTYDLLRMRITPLMTSLHAISVCMHVVTKMAERISVKFGVDVMPSKTTPNSYFYVPTTGTTNVTDAQSREVGRR